MTKKLLAICMVGIFLFSLTGFGYADQKVAALSKTAAVESTTKISKEDATKIATKALKDYFNFDLDEKQYQSNIQLTPDYMDKDTYVWNFGWYSYNGTSNISVNAGVDANTGKLVNVNKYDFKAMSSRTEVAKYTEEQGKGIAEAFIEKINPGVLKNTKLIKNLSSYMYNVQMPNYTYRYTRVENGLQYDDNYIEVQCDGVTGSVVSYNCRWNDKLSFPPKDKVIDLPTATDILNKNMKLKLQYITYRNTKYPSDQPLGIKLAYVPVYDNGSSVDAVTGEMIQAYQGYPGGTSKTVDLSSAEKDAFLSKYKQADSVSKELDKTGAEQKVKDILKNIYTTEAAVDFMNYSQNNYNGQNSVLTWGGQFSISGDNPTQGYVSIDANSGQLLNMNTNNYGYMPNENFTPKITWEEGYKKAIDLLTKLYPEKLKDIDTEQTWFNGPTYFNGKEMPTPMYSYNFCRKINNISYTENAINFTYDAKTGQLSNIYCNWDNSLKFPDANNVLSNDNARNIYKDNFKLTLKYVSYNKNKQPDKYDLGVKLGYGLSFNEYSVMDMPLNLDAVTGRVVNYSGEDVLNLGNDEFAKKISGNQYEKEISLLATMGMIDTKSFDLNKETSKIDLIKALVTMKGYRYYSPQPLTDLKFTDIKKDDANYKYVQMAVNYDILKNEETKLNLDETLTKEDIIKYLVDLTPYSKLASAKDIFTLNYSDVKDISSDKYGYVAIAKGLSILDGSSNVLNPKGKIKNDEFAHLIFNVSKYVTNMY